MNPPFLERRWRVYNKRAGARTKKACYSFHYQAERVPLNNSQYQFSILHEFSTLGACGRGRGPVEIRILVQGDRARVKQAGARQTSTVHRPSVSAASKEVQEIIRDKIINQYRGNKRKKCTADPHETTKKVQHMILTRRFLRFPILRHIKVPQKSSLQLVHPTMN